MIQVYTNPLLLDFIRVCIEMQPPERQQLEWFTGEPYDVDGAAIGNFQVPGPKWVIKDGETPIAVGGFVPLRPGVWRDFLLPTPACWSKENWFAVSRACRRGVDAMFRSGQAHRVECIATLAREHVFPWYRIMGYNRESTMYGYCANGADAVMFSRVSHFNGHG